MTSDGRVLVADTGNHCIRVLDRSLHVVHTLAGEPGIAGFDEGADGRPLFDAPFDVAELADGSVAVADRMNHCIRRIHNGKAAITLWENPLLSTFLVGVWCDENCSAKPLKHAVRICEKIGWFVGPATSNGPHASGPNLVTVLVGNPEQDGIRDGHILVQVEDKHKVVTIQPQALLSEPEKLLMLSNGNLAFSDKHSIRQVA